MAKIYDTKGADKLLKDYSKLTGFDIKTKSRKTDPLLLRVLFYNILVKKNFMHTQQIEDYFLTKGHKLNRSSTYSAISKTEYYYDNFPSFKSYYDIYFNSGEVSEDEAIMKSEHATLNPSKKALYDIIDTIEESNLEDVLEMVTLRVKSYAWRNKDKERLVN